MFIKVHNALKERAGESILISTNIIGYLCEDHNKDGNKFTVIYANDKLVWHVEESLEEIENLIKKTV